MEQEHTYRWVPISGPNDPRAKDLPADGKAVLREGYAGTLILEGQRIVAVIGSKGEWGDKGAIRYIKGVLADLQAKKMGKRNSRWRWPWSRRTDV